MKMNCIQAPGYIRAPQQQQQLHCLHANHQYKLHVSLIPIYLLCDRKMKQQRFKELVNNNKAMEVRDGMCVQVEL